MKFLPAEFERKSNDRPAQTLTDVLFVVASHYQSLHIFTLTIMFSSNLLLL